MFIQPGYFQTQPTSIRAQLISASSNTSNYDVSSPLDASGNFLWADGFGETSADFSYSSTVDNSNNVLTTGTFNGTVDFDPTSGVANLNAVGSTEIFIQNHGARINH